MENWINVEYKYKGITSIYPFIIAQKQIKTSFSTPLQITGQICRSYSGFITCGHDRVTYI